MNDFDAIFGLWRARACEWKDPPGSNTAPECGKPVVEGRAYCKECHQKAYQKATKKPKGRKNERKQRVLV